MPENGEQPVALGLVDAVIANTVSVVMGNLDAKQQAAVRLVAASAVSIVMFVGAWRAIGAARAGDSPDATALIWLGLLIVAIIWLLTNLRQLLVRR